MPNLSGTSMYKAFLFVISVSFIVFVGCSKPAMQHQVSAPSMVGGDRDSHRCIGSAGYSWCEKEAACVRSWELASEKGFENSSESFQKYCSGKL